MKTLNKIEHYRSSGGKLVATALAVAFAAWAPTSIAANVGEDLANMFKNGEFDVNFRYRYEWVDQDDNGKKSANASTLRTRLVFRTAKWNDFDVTINMDDVHTIIGNDYNSTRNGKTQYQTVADPKGTDLNIAALTYSGITNTTIVAGRQRIIRGNARFIGNVGWRQNEQTYDALSANFKNDTWSFNYAYLDRVNRIFGPEAGAPTEKFNSDSNILDGSFTLANWMTISAYAYLLEFENAQAGSSDTYGARISGAPKIGDNWAITYAAEYAQQEDGGENPTDYEADYILAELGFKVGVFALKAGYELLEADETAGVAFQTPLATLHAHNGWADKFLGTPAGGLEDTYIAGSAKLGKGTLKLIYHDFSSDVGSVDYGTEIDFLAKWPLGDNYSILGKLAYYDGDKNAPAGSLAQDTTKAWLMFTAAF